MVVQLDLLERLALMVPVADLVHPDERDPLAQWEMLELMDLMDLMVMLETQDLPELWDQTERG